MKTLITLVLVLLLAGCAAGQGGAGRSPSEEATANGKEETSVYQEETTVLAGAEGNLSRPPVSTLSYGGQEVKGALGTYCWSSGNSWGCADSSGPFIAIKRKTLTVPPDSEMVFRYGGQNPPKTVEAGAYSLDKLKDKKGGVVRLDRSLKAHGSGVQRTIPATLTPGEYVLEVSIEEPTDNQAAFSDNEANYYFRIVVE